MKSFPSLFYMKNKLVFLALAITLIPYPFFGSEIKNGDKPNVLFVAIDDLNDWVGCMGGNPQAKTPNFDKFYANGGMVMYKAHSPATVCCPSRSALLTGVHAHKTGVYGNNNNLKYAPKAKDLVTLPEYFSKNGYTSLTMGKIFHRQNYTDRENDNGQWAFDEYNNTLSGMGPLSNQRPVNGLPNLEDENPSSYHYTAFDWGPTKENDETEMMDYKTARWAANQFQNRDFEKPFFMAVGISKPHLTWYVPQKYFDMYPLDEIELPNTIPNDLEDIFDKNGKQAYQPHDTWRRVEKYGRHKEAVRAYLATITFVDDCIGVLLDGLAKSKYADNTIVVLWGDHGWHLGEKQKYGKTQLWQESCRVPLMVKVPGITPNNKRCNGLVNLIDLYPTLVELCDLPENHKNDGKSFAELLYNPDMQWNYPTLTTNAYNEHRIYDGRYSYSYHQSRGIEQLYDHQNDSMEWTNLANNPDFAEIKERMKKLLPESNEPEAPRNANLPPTADTTSKVWVFPDDTLLAWQFDYFSGLADDTLFALDSAQTIGIYGCNDTSGFNVRSYSDAENYKDAAQFKWNAKSETFQNNGQWAKYSVKFTGEKPYQLAVRARNNVDANFKLTITNNDDIDLFKDLNLNEHFINNGGGNDETDWFVSKFPINDLWGHFEVGFDWYDNIGEPGIFGAFSFTDSKLDLTPPEWYFVSIGDMSIGTDLVVMTTENATVYLVPHETPQHADSINLASIAIANVTAYTQFSISTNGLSPGKYVVYAIDSSKNISEASRQINLQIPVNTKKMHAKSNFNISYSSSGEYFSIQCNNPLKLIDMYTISGKKVKSIIAGGNEFQFNTKGLNSGIYIIKVFDISGGMSALKIANN